MVLDTDFSSNRHTVVLQEHKVPVRHTELSFEDANLAIVTGCQYFLVHRGLLCHHSPVLKESIGSIRSDHDYLLEGCPVLSLQDSPEEMACFLRALYG